MSKKAAIYARVSTEDQRDNYSLGGQIADCTAYAKEKGYEVVAEFLETFSGAALYRPELDKLRKMIGQIDAVIVYELDRLSRNAVHLTIIEDEFEFGGAPIEYVKGYADTAEGQLLKNIQINIKQYERTIISTRMETGKIRRAKSGKVIISNHAPFGYDLDREKGMLVINDYEAEIVRKIFQWYIHGDESGKKLGARSISNKLMEMKVLPKSINSRKKDRYYWEVCTVRLILSNETYIGTWYYNKKKYIKNGDSRKRVERPKSEWIGVPVPAILDEETFYRAQTQKDINYKTSPRNVQYEYLLQGKMVCAHCGKPFTCETYVRPYYPNGKGIYHCGGQSRRTHNGVDVICHGSLPKEQTDNLIWNEIVKVFENPDALLKSAHAYMEQSKEDTDALRGYMRTIEKNLEDLKQKESRFLDLYAEAGIEKDILKQKLNTIREERERFSDELASIQDRMKVYSPVNIEEVKRLCEDIAEGIADFNFDEKRRILEMFDVRVIVQRGKDRNSDQFTITGELDLWSDHSNEQSAIPTLLFVINI